MGRNKARKPDIQLKSKLKKDPGVPRLPGLKQRAEKKQQACFSPPARNDPDSTMASEPTLSSLAAMASAQQSSDPSSSQQGQKTKEQLRRHYVRALHKVIDESDIVVLVLDARDPEGCRSRLVEEEVRRREGEGKKLVFVLNKIDLVPKDNAQQWLRYLRHSTPTLPFKSASNSQRAHLSSSTAPALLRLLKAYKPSAAQSITVGVVGYPNVGKSSLINSLKRAKVCAVAAQPGHTKELQSIQLERGIRVVDSPGVIFDDDDISDGKGTKKGSVLLRNVVKVEDVDDPIAVVEEILARTEPETLQKIYNLPQFTSTLEFLTMLALSSGRLLKGGTPDILGAARQVLKDWNQQKIPYFSIPPTVHPSSVPTAFATAHGETFIAPGAEAVGQAQILTELGKPFSLDGLFGSADAGAFDDRDPNMPMETDLEAFADDQHPMDEDGIQMESDDLAPSVPRKRSRSASPSPSLPRNGETGEPGFAPSDGRGAGSERAPKRLRREKVRDAPGWEERAMARANPLNRRAIKQGAKKARRAAARANRAAAMGDAGGMELETDDGLRDTFMFS